MSRGFARLGWPRGQELIQSANFVASATPHTKGSWVEIDAAAAENVVGLFIRGDANIASTGVDTSMLIDIGVGAGGAEVPVVANIPVGGHTTTAGPVFLPIAIPAGSRIAGRCQSLIGSAVFDPNIRLMFGGRPGMWAGFSIAETIGVDTATSAPTTGDLADNAWDEAIASTVNAYRALTFHPCLIGTATTAGGNIDIGVGAAGSELVIGTWLTTITSAEAITRLEGAPFIERGIPAGSRLAIRKNFTGDCSGALIGWR